MFKRYIKWLVISLSLIVVGIILIPFVDHIIGHVNNGRQVEPTPVSLLRIISDPRNFDGVEVITEGFMKLSDESLGNRLYIDENSAKNYMTYNSIIISPNYSDKSLRGYNKKYNTLKMYDRSYVYMKGQFELQKYDVEDRVIDLMVLRVDYYGSCFSDPEVEPNIELCGPLVTIPERPTQN